MTQLICRFCGVGLQRSFVDLGRAPLSNSFLTTERLRKMEPHYPFHAYVCENCLLVQLEEFESAETIFSDYLYFSSFSEMWLRHAEAFAARMTRELKLGGKSLVVEIASNDGYLLQYFRQSGRRRTRRRAGGQCRRWLPNEGVADRGRILRRANRTPVG